MRESGSKPPVPAKIRWREGISGRCSSRIPSDIGWNVALLQKRLEALQTKNVISDELVTVPAVDRIAVGPTTG